MVNVILGMWQSWNLNTSVLTQESLAFNHSALLIPEDDLTDQLLYPSIQQN